MTERLKNPRAPVTAHLKADIDAGLADVTVGLVEDFDVTRIVERGRKLLADRSSAVRKTP